MKYLLVISFLFLLVRYVEGDLPIHALMGDVAGIWDISQTEELSDKPEHCGGGIPNRNFQNLDPQLKKYERFLENNYGGMETTSMKLTTEKINLTDKLNQRNNWTYLAVRDANTNGIIGHWTMVYDEGFEVRVPGRRYFALFKYERTNSKKCPEPIENKDSTDSNCYITDPTRTLLGWVLHERVHENDKKKKVFQWGCFYGRKQEDVGISSFVIHGAHSSPPSTEEREKSMGSSTWTGGNILLPTEKQLSFASIKQRSNYTKIRLSSGSPHGVPKTSLMSIYQRTKERIFGCRKEDSEEVKIRLTLPKAFTWGDPFSDDNFEEDVEDQMNCGSCYSIATLYSLQKRFEIGLFKKYRKKITVPKLSYQSILSCSPYNQGCDGGFPFLVGKHLYEFGIPAEDSFPYGMSDSIKCEMSMGSYNNITSTTYKEKDLFFVGEYNYVSGCYECSNEFDMMKEIYSNGPIVVAINATAQLLGLYKLGKQNSMYDIATHENKVCDIPNEGFNGWQQTNHAVTIVGWGEVEKEQEGGNLIKYWVVRNTWGKTWGYKGYIKFQRGVNLAGIETQAVFLDPDLSRGRAGNISGEER
ncbi:dipeptidyl aminopeptidase 2, putative [Plasmodium knowlesi strain H]|uniref:Dipeptidyl peptidase 1 n=3 Tax=Plasmodium knowlesi TaxID=5850 RepID=A0A1A7W4B3_PLAKH|nr:dipeptidyl aminopeptidase 2, putative [Plasmodium knowlesi strain H]OTN64197.1 putative Dipeptidyl aminopeptidase 2 [Plasmodium knowlesi]CAA9991272.1 dipeptidyl aminopeptidase 2, putative [Plasmodium knowlesi strain H]SBO26360.1 dipeptidyl aminopeptidase 2, putative [Plasmodium knowlesi strain H]SBO29021.1 dipeptidyl aminopeptidase 2, putative [Plasmodium knowlesi strain H]VVS80746.1 dipeptidyl aminopeptidase 2, putative [Plasmodium knowlesi strain H]